MFYKELDLAALVDLEDWQKTLDSFAEAFEITMRTVSLDGTPLSRISHPSKYCTDIISKIPDVTHFCGYSAPINSYKKLTAAVHNGGRMSYPFGVDIIVIPVKTVGDRIVAYVILGPVILNSRKAKDEYAKEAEKYVIDLNEIMDALIDINVFSYNKIHAIAGLIANTFSYMARTGYHKKRLGEIAPEVVEMDPLFSKYYEEKILSAMLKTCSLALNADSGSVMIVDKDTRTLHIKVASRLDNKIVNNTSIRIGEGIAGVAAATAKPIILPKDKDKSGLSGKMKRRGIKSSMIVPFNKGNTQDVYGVINLNIVRRNAAFSGKDIALVKELVNLTSIALIPLKKQ